MRKRTERPKPARRGTAGRAGAAAVAGALAIAAAGALLAAPVKLHQLSGAAGFLGGTFDGVRLDERGDLVLGRAFERTAPVDEPFAFALARLPGKGAAAGDGAWAIGTGNDGKVLRVGPSGDVTTLFDAPEPEVFALWADPDGTLFAGTSPNGKVYRIRDGRGEPFFDPRSDYIWAIARGADGSLWVATGSEGKLFRVDASGEGTAVWDSDEIHLRSLLPLADGRLLVGTVGQGRVVERTPAGALRTLYDSPLAEVVSLTRGAGGDVYAAVLASEASFADLEPKPKESAASGEASESKDDASDASPTATAGTRAANATGPRSELVRLTADGLATPLWSSQDETLFAVVADTGGSTVWLGTGGEGKLYSTAGDSVRFETALDERQIVALAATPDGPRILTTNAAALYRPSPKPRPRGTFTSAVADAAQPARYGVLRWTGAKPKGTKVSASFRFGASTSPDDSWTEWSAPVVAAVDAASGGEIAVPAAPPVRFVQYRLELEGSDGVSPVVAGVELSYRQINQRPKIERFGAMEPGQILVPANFNPSDQVYEPTGPNRDGIFTTLEPATDGRTKTLWKRGMRTLRWRGSDPNGDELRATVSVRAEGADRWYELVRERKEDSYGFDATALPDGRYRFRLVLSDATANDPASALAAEEESDAVVVDHSPPRRRAVERRGGGVRVTIADDWNPLTKAEVSVDAGPWRDLVPVDGLVDGRSETFDLSTLPRDASLVLLRVTDAAWNNATFDLGEELEP